MAGRARRQPQDRGDGPNSLGPHLPSLCLRGLSCNRQLAREAQPPQPSDFKADTRSAQYTPWGWRSLGGGRWGHSGAPQSLRLGEDLTPSPQDRPHPHLRISKPCTWKWAVFASKCLFLVSLYSEPVGGPSPVGL